MNVDPLIYGLSSRVKLVEISDNHLGIEKLIKSRIIQKDAAKIVEMVRAIQQVNASVKVSLVCSRNICSKSLALLAKENIAVIYKDL